MKKNYNREYKIRLIGLSCTNFVNEEDDFRQLSLFETQEETDVFSAVCDLPQNYKTVIYLMYYEYIFKAL